MNWVDFSGFLEKKLNVKSSHFLSFAFTKEFFVDFRTSSTKGSCTYFRWTIYVFILMPHTYPLGKSRKFVFNIFGNYRCQRILLSFFELTMAKMKIFCFFDANFRKFPKLISKFIDLMKEWMHSADLAKSLKTQQHNVNSLRSVSLIIPQAAWERWLSGLHPLSNLRIEVEN